MEDDSLRASRTLRLDSPPAGNIAKSAWQLNGVGLRSFSQARPWVLATIVIAGFTIWGYAFIGPSGRIEPGRIDQHRTDFTVFTEAGSAFFDGRNPYRVANPRGWHYLYPPLFALLVAPLSIFDTESQVVFWYAVNVALAFGCFVEAGRLWRLVAGPETRGIRWLGGCAALAVLLPFLDCMQAGQLGIAILYLLMVGSRLVLQGKSWALWFLGGLTLSLPASIKLVPSLPVVFLLFQQWLAVALPRRSGRPWGRAITSTAGVSSGALLFLLVIPGSILGWNRNLQYLDVWQKQIVTNERVGSDSNFNIHSYRNQSLANAVYLWSESTREYPTADSVPLPVRGRPERIAHPIVPIAIGVILVVLLAVVAIVSRRGDGLDAFTAFSLACCAILLVSPLSWGHYFMAELPALICVPIWLWRRGMPIAARVAAVIPVMLSWSYYLAMPWIGGLGVLGLGTAGWFLVACGVMLWSELRGGREHSLIASLQEQGLARASRPHRVVRARLIGLRPAGKTP
jgi:hypothetical protein